MKKTKKLNAFISFQEKMFKNQRVAHVLHNLTAIPLLLFTILIFTIISNAQNSYIPAALKGGSSSASVNLSEFESIDPYSGNLNFSLPLAEVGGRGTNSLPIKLNISQRWMEKVWRDYLDSGRESYYMEANVWDVNYRGVDINIPIRVSGIQSGQGFRQNCPGVPEEGALYSYTQTTLTFITPDGTSHQMRDRNSSGQPRAVECNQNAYNRGTVFQTNDGSSAIFTSDDPIYDEPWYGYEEHHYWLYPTGNLLTKDGTLYRIENGEMKWSRDKNGNKMTLTHLNSGFPSSGFKMTDSLNREVVVEYNVQDVAPYGLCHKITRKGFGGVDKITRVSYASMQDHLRTGYSLQTGRQLFPQNFGSGYPPHFNGWDGLSVYGDTKVSTIWLPDGKSYKLKYNSHGEIARVELPTGGAIEYDWGFNSGTGQIGFHYNTPNTPTAYSNFYRRVTERRSYSDGVNLDNKLVYGGLESLGNRTGYVIESLYGNASSLINRTKHYYYGIVGSSDAFIYLSHIFQDPWRDGREYQTEVFGSNGTTLLVKTTSTWQQSSPHWWTQPSAYAPVNNPRTIESTTTLVDSNQISKKTFSYDNFNNLTDTYEYDFKQGATFPFLRRSHTDYLTTNSVNGTDYTSDGVHILNLPEQTWVSSDSAGDNKVSFTKFEYDNYSAASADTKHDPLLDRANISGHDPAFGTGYKTRGNLTAITGYTNAANQSGEVTSYRKYDIAGNPIATIDAEGYVSSLNYTDRFGLPDAEARSNTAPAQLNGQQTFAFAASATNPAGYSTYGQFDYFTGAAVDAEDITGNVSSTFYTSDPLDRPTQVIAANNRPQFRRQTTIAYDDTLREVTTTSDSKLFNDNLLKGKTLYDKMGRTKETRQYETATDYIAAQQEYDALGRAFKSSNPFRFSEINAANPIRWTESKFDSLGRVIEVKTPDNAVVTREYFGTTATITDQSLKKRSGTTDAIGRLLKVNEDPTGVNYETIYLYDVLGRLRKATQAEGTTIQNRYFMYNDLGRLIRAKQPEQIANTGLPAMTDPITGNSNWSVAYNYDSNGNISSTTDANNRTVTGTYDNLNRLIFRDYSDTATPDVTFTFDNLNVTNSRGQLTAVTTTNSSTQHTSFDQLGRVKSSRQITNGQTYDMPNYSYDLSGALVAQTYPSLRVVTTETDPLGRLSKVLSQMPNQNSRMYLSSLSYTSFGAVSSARLGNGSWESAQFDSQRLQIKQLGLGASNGDASYLKLEYDYGADNNGSLRQQKITVQGAATPITQAYDYDALNRLQSATETVSGSSSPAWKQTYAYDRFGNRRFDTSVGATTTLPQNNGIYNPSINQANNRFTVAEGYNYDNEGNLTNTPESQLFVYNSENQQTQAQGANGTTDYYYDGRGKRVRKVVGTQETIFVYDAFGKMVSEYTINQTITSEGTKYLTTDALGSPRAITDTSGHVVSRHDYMPFGEEVYGGVGGRTAAQGYLINGDGVRQQFTGYERDVESGLDYAQARYFSSKHGRFTSVDPLTASAIIKNPQTFNRYSYGLNSPYMFTDPLGLRPCKVPGGGNTGCISEGDLSNGGTERALEGYNQRLQNTLDSNAANRAFADGDNEGGFAIVNANSNLTANYTSRRTGRTWVVANIEQLEEKVASGEWDGYRSGPKNIRWCATLPQLWDDSNGVSVVATQNWIMGPAVEPGLEIARGTVLATFDRSTGKYANNPSGNHTVIFLEWVKKISITTIPLPTSTGMMTPITYVSTSHSIKVIEQGPQFNPRSTREIPYEGGRLGSTNYFNNAWYYNVVKVK